MELMVFLHVTSLPNLPSFIFRKIRMPIWVVRVTYHLKFMTKPSKRT